MRWNYKSDLVFLKGHGPWGGCGKDDYINQVLKPVVSSAMKELKAREFKLLYQKNGNGIHGLKGMNKLHCLKEDLGIHAIHEWLSTSADFNSIENVWWILKQWIHTKGQNRTLAQCKAALLKEWEVLTQEKVQKCIKMMPKRMAECIDWNGYFTSFWCHWVTRKWDCIFKYINYLNAKFQSTDLYGCAVVICWK